jgi:hypothetical protein
MAAGENEGQKPGREVEAEAWERRIWQKIGEGREEEEAGNFRSGRRAGDHVPLSRAARALFGLEG